MTDFWGKADISPGVRQNMGLVRFIPGVGVSAWNVGGCEKNRVLEKGIPHG